MPALDEKQYVESLGIDGNIEIHGENGTSQNGVTIQDPVDLLMLDDIPTQPTSATTVNPAPLDDLIPIGLDPTMDSPAPTGPSSSTPLDLMDLLGDPVPPESSTVSFKNFEF